MYKKKCFLGFLQINITHTHTDSNNQLFFFFFGKLFFMYKENPEKLSLKKKNIIERNVK